MSFVVVSKTGCSHLVVWDGENLARYSFKSNSLQTHRTVRLYVLACPYHLFFATTGHLCGAAGGVTKRNKGCAQLHLPLRPPLE